MPDQKIWRCCKCGSFLGRIEYKSIIPVLRLESIVIIGEAEVMCDDCGAVNKWYPNIQALYYLFDNMKERKGIINKKLIDLRESVEKGGTY